MSVAGLLPPETIRRIAEANPIEEIVGADLSLKKAGAVLIGLCPFHREKSPSFTLTPARQRYKCFGCGASGDGFAYIMARDGVSFRDSARLLAHRAGIHLEEAGTVERHPIDRRPRQQSSAVHSVESRVLRLPPDSRAATRTELQIVAEQRGLSVAGLMLAARCGLLVVGSPKGIPAWIVKDAEGINAQARRLDGRRWELASGQPKAYTLPGSRAAWPIGVKEAAAFPFVVLVEGAPDLLAAYHFIAAEERETDTAAVAMLGAANDIPETALQWLAHKRVRLFPHSDAAGHEAAQRWTRQLDDIGCDVDAFAFDGLRRTDGDAVGDLNDLAAVNADDFEAERADLERILPG